MGICCSSSTSQKNSRRKSEINKALSVTQINSSTNLNKKSTVNYYFNLQYNNTEIFAQEPIERPLCFFFRLFNFKIKNLSLSPSLLAISITIIDTEQTLYSNIIKGKDLKFNLDLSSTCERAFTLLSNPFIRIDFYAIDEQVEEIENTKQLIEAKNLLPISSFTIDLLTVAIGPEHHDLPLLAYSKAQKKTNIGRISFNIICSHFNKIEVSIPYFSVKLKHFLNQNELSLQFSLIDPIEHDMIESNNIMCIKPDHSEFKNFTSTFTWRESDSEKLKVEKSICWSELKKAYLNINLKESVLLLNEDISMSLCEEIEEESSVQYFKNKKNSGDDISDKSNSSSSKSSLVSHEKIRIMRITTDNPIGEELTNSKDQIDSVIKNYAACYKPCLKTLKSAIRDGNNTNIVQNPNNIILTASGASRNSIQNSPRRKSPLVSPIRQGNSKVKKSSSIALRKYRSIINNRRFSEKGSFNVVKTIGTSKSLLNTDKLSNIDSVVSKPNANFTRYQTQFTQTEKFNSFKKFDIVEKTKQDEFMYNLETEFKGHGVSELHFNEILDEKDSIITKQCSRIFQTFSHLYKNKKRRFSDNLEKFPDDIKMEINISKHLSNDNVKREIFNNPQSTAHVNFNQDATIVSNRGTPQHNPNSRHSYLQQPHINGLRINTDVVSMNNPINNDNNTERISNFEKESETNCRKNSQEVDWSAKKAVKPINDSKYSPVAYALTMDHKSKSHDEPISYLKLSIFESFKKKITENIYYKGESIGTLELEILIKNIPMIKQIQCGVHTERGFDISSNYLIPTISNAGKGPKELIELQNYYSIIIKKLTEHCGIRTVFYQRESNKELKYYLTQILNLLKISVKESYLFYSYNSSDDIIKAQKIMIELSSNLITFFDSVNIEIKSLMFNIIELVCSRLELELDLVSLDEELIEKYFMAKTSLKCTNKHNHSVSHNDLNYNLNYVMTNNHHINPNANSNTTQNHSVLHKNEEEPADFIKKKVTIASEFIDLALSLLEYALENISKKVHDEGSKHFYEFILSFCYFRLTPFQEEFLSVISSGITEPYIFSYKSFKITNSDYLEERFDQQDVLLNPVNSLIDWDLLFFERYKKFGEFYFDSKQAKLKNIINNKEWKEKLKKRGPAFISIIIQIKSYIKRKIVLTRNIRWKDIPGFVLLLNTIYYDLLNKEVKSISTACISLMKSFINDSSILNRFIQIIVSRTTVYDVNSVIKVFDILHAFFQEYNENRIISSFPYKVDYNLIWKACKLIFENDHYMCICKVLWFVYHNSHLFNIESYYNLLKLILNDWFFFLFFHWSFQVRNIFYYYLLFIIQHKLKCNFDKSFTTEVSNIKHRRSILIDKLTEKDENGFMNAVKKDYFENMKNSILKEYYSKLRIIMKIRSSINKNVKAQELKDYAVSSNYFKGEAQENNSIYLSPKKINPSNPADSQFGIKLKNDESENDKDSKKTLSSERKAVEMSMNYQSKLLEMKNGSLGKNPVIIEENKMNKSHIINSPKRGTLINIVEDVSDESIRKKSKVASGHTSLLNLLSKDKEVSMHITGIQIDYIILGINQFTELEEQFKVWSSEIDTMNSEVYYPKVEIQQMKDDLFDYSDNEN